MVTDYNSIQPLSVNARKRELPAVITRMVLGARVVNPWHGQEDAYSIEDVVEKRQLWKDDFIVAESVAKRIIIELSLNRIISAHEVLNIRERAQEIIESMTDDRAGKTGILMLKDQGGCGYWRAAMPARYMDTSDLYIDITSGKVDFGHLLDYKTVFVQRIHDWESVEVLRRLKKLGKKIVYDIDDDLFSIPEGNPARNSIGRNEHMAALECMRIADVVTTTTRALQERLTYMLDGIVPVIVPNAYDFDSSWLPTEQTGSPDGYKRIFWQGSNTHDLDWSECFEAVDIVMSKYDNLRMVVLGFLPSLIQKNLKSKQWNGKVEYMGPLEPEAYFQLIHHVRAEVGLAPVLQNAFNESKSPIKFMENAMIGMPTVASNVRAYSDYIKNGEDGFLCKGTEEWVKAIELCLNDKSERLRILENAREKVRRDFDIKKVAKRWKDILA